jgi:hypothetical protein
MVGDDYARACAVSYFLGKIPLGDGYALVLGDTPDNTRMIETNAGLALLRWGCADSDEIMLRFAHATMERAEILETLEHSITESSQLLIDSAWSGSDFEESLELNLLPGAYTISTRKHEEGTTKYVAHVFKKY